MRIKERIQRLEKTLKPDLETPDYHIIFVGKNSDGSMKSTLGVIYYADGREWMNPEIYPIEKQKRRSVFDR